MTSSTFHAFDLHPDILASVDALGYKTPTPIQQKSIPSILLGQDVMGLAQTGTGKTAAFVLPILQRLISGQRGKIRSLIIAPTRELAQQTHEAIGTLAKTLRLRSATLYGGVAMSPQIKNLRQADVVVACPGRLLDHIRQRTIDLSNVEVLVLDEADHMFDVGFLPDIRQILKELPHKRQSLLFSATMPSEVRQLANDILKNPVTVQINNTAAVTTITQALYPVSQHLKTDLLIKLLQTHQIYSALVFTRTKHRAKRVAEQLESAGYSSTSLQGNLSQSKRQSALNSFRSGKLQILVATDIASRGIDIASISHVFNYDMPDTVEAYTHRIGRTGRAAKLGDAFTLLAREDASKLRTLERALGIKIEQRMVPDFDYKAVGKSGSMHDDSPRRPSRTSADSRTRRPFTSKRPTEFAQSDRPAGRSRYQGSADRSQSERPAARARAPGNFAGDRNHGERPAARARPSGNFAGDRNYSERPASRARAPGGFAGDRNHGERPVSRARAPGNFAGDRNHGERPASRTRAPGNFAGDRNHGERPASRARAPGNFAGDRNHGERPASRARPSGNFAGDRNYSERPASRARAPGGFAADKKHGERPATRVRAPGGFTANRNHSERPAKAPFKPSTKGPNSKAPFAAKKPKHEDE